MARSHGRRRRGHGAEGGESDERWLLTYADMITLLMALFMVLFSISSVNISKFQTLQQALHAAFSGDILPGGKSIAQPGATANSSHAPSSADVQAIVPLAAQPASGLQSTAAAAQQQASEFARIKAKLDAYAKAHNFSSNVKTSIQQQGLVIRVLTDKLLFASGSAALKSGSFPLLGEISQLLDVDRLSPIAVQGNTDDIPIHSGVYPSNWELSTARASTVVRYLIGQRVGAPRLSAAGYADQRPIANNASASGRERNRRVEIVLQRLPGPSTSFSAGS
jgi:chemotaxis protein MotB